MDLAIGAPKISIDDVHTIQQQSPDIILYALPAVALFTIAEVILAKNQHKEIYETQETLGSILVGGGNFLVNMLLKIVLLYAAVWIYNFVPWRISLNWWTFVPCYLLYDFCSYWSHRVSHFNRFFWASHVVHHSAEHYNLSVSFRQSWVQHFKLIFFLPLAFIGFHPIIFFATGQLSVLYQFWVHSGCIGKLHPLIESIFVTPSNHRVHHGSNERYIDKNFAATFIFWDRIFGTFEEEQEEAIFGITHKLDSKINPFYLNFHEYADIVQDVKMAKGFKNKWHYLFGRPHDISLEKQKNLHNNS